MKGQRGGQISAWDWMELRIMGVHNGSTGSRTQDEGSPSLSHKEDRETRLRETPTAVCETRPSCSAEQSSSGSPLDPVSSQTPGRKQEK